ncbi:MAG: hypothetical protein ACK5M7_05425 [Draconibacterium sp.]
MNTLLIYPEKENNTRNWLNKLGLNTKKDRSIPLELLELSIELPITWEKKLIDLNEEKLQNKDILWADLIVVKAQNRQLKSAGAIITRCSTFQKRIIVQGELDESPRWTTENVSKQDFAGIVDRIFDNSFLEGHLDTSIQKSPNIGNSEYSLFDFSSNLRKRLQIVLD